MGLPDCPGRDCIFKYQKLKQKYNGIQKELDDMRKENHKLSEEKNIMQGV